MLDIKLPASIFIGLGSSRASFWFETVDLKSITGWFLVVSSFYFAEFILFECTFSLGDVWPSSSINGPVHFILRKDFYLRELLFWRF